MRANQPNGATTTQPESVAGAAILTGLALLVLIALSATVGAIIGSAF